MSFRVYLISRPQFNVETFLSFLNEQGKYWTRTTGATESEELVEVAARICYMSFGENQSKRKNSEFIKEFITMGHESVLEHANWSFLIIGVSRAFTHQLVRHRVGFSFSQLSQQYCSQRDAEFVEPSLLRNSPDVLEIWKQTAQVVKNAYKDIIEKLDNNETNEYLGISKKEFKRAIRSVARSVLPNATETKILLTANARALRHFFKVRGSIPGDEEMRHVATEILKYLKVEAPSFFFDFEIQKLPDGSPIIIHNKG